MNEKEVLREALKSCGWTQTTLAEKMGYSSQSSISGRLTGNSLRVDTFVRMLDVMGYEVVVRSKSPKVNPNKWVLGNNGD